MAEGVEGKGLPAPRHVIECVPVSIEISQLYIERTHRIPIQEVQDMFEMDEAQVRQLISTGQLETHAFEGEPLVSLKSYNAYGAKTHKFERSEESGRGIDWDW